MGDEFRTAHPCRVQGGRQGVGVLLGGVPEVLGTVADAVPGKADEREHNITDEIRWCTDLTFLRCRDDPAAQATVTVTGPCAPRNSTTRSGGVC